MIKSPCVGICEMNLENNFCKGCGRSSHQITNWIFYSEKQKKEILARNKKIKSPVSGADEEWLNADLTWLRETFSEEHFHQIRTITPTVDFYDRTFSGTEDDAYFVLERTKELMAIQNDHIKLTFFDNQPTYGEDGSMLSTPSDNIQGSWDAAAGTYEQTKEGETVISLDLGQLKDPIALIATIAHELAHVILLGEGYLEENDEFLTDLTAIFYGYGLEELVKKAKDNVESNAQANVFGYYVNNPKRYGVVEFDKSGEALSVEEKPTVPKSNYAVVGLYFYPNSVIEIAENIKPSQRGELEITSVNEEYLKRSELEVNLMGRGFAWLDTGTHDSLAEAGEFVKALEKRQGLKIGCIEENCLEQGFISKKEAILIGQELSMTEYGQYLINRANQWK